ncbi:MAG: tRNA (guanosine(37)-N1)-methyltransferase TrmD [Clostridia bacterium]|nr:tRNA (guanosine(37)-N1)-methyltransferase TrmD [Clostridia bacterium]
MKFDILTLFPDLVDRILSESVIGRARTAGIIEVNAHQIRDYACNKHNNVDDTPYGGGNGMVMAAPPIDRCFKAVLASLPANETRRTVYLSPKGTKFDQAAAKRLAGYDRLILLCGHYEGVDQRAIDRWADEEISIGDYVLTGGELPACILVDAVARLIDGVLASPECHEEESIASGLLEYPQYTRPPVYEGEEVPAILLSGDHAKIDAWRLERALEVTKERRPDLYEAYLAAHPPKPEKGKKGSKKAAADGREP